MEQNTKQYTEYDYKSITVSNKNEAICKDAYQSLGWEFERREAVIQKPLWGPFRVMLAPLAIFPGSPFKEAMNHHASLTKEVLYFKRNRAIEGKLEKNKLLTEIDAHMIQMDKAETNKTVSASIAGYLIGLIGTIFMGLSVFAYLDSAITMSMVFAVPGFVGWIIAFLAYRTIKKRKAYKVEQEQQETVETIHQLCQKGYAVA